MAKPAVAFASEAKARENLVRKLERLTSLLKQGALKPDVPSSLNQFNAWTHVGTRSSDSFVSNAHETLTRHEDLRSAAETLVKVARSSSRKAVPPRELSLQRARERTNLHQRLRQIAEVHALKVMEENVDLKQEKQALLAQIDSMAIEMTAIRTAYEEELQKLRERNAELVRAQSTKIRAFGKRE